MTNSSCSVSERPARAMNCFPFKHTGISLLRHLVRWVFLYFFTLQRELKLSPIIHVTFGKLLFSQGSTVMQVLITIRNVDEC